MGSDEAEDKNIFVTKLGSDEAKDKNIFVTGSARHLQEAEPVALVRPGGDA